MEKIINFPTRVQYTKEYLTKNQRVKQRQGIAQRLTRGHEGVVTIEWEGVKSIGHVHLDFLEEVLPATTITMENNTQLPVEVVEEIKNKAINYSIRIIEAQAYKAGATAYASKLHQANEVIKVLEYDNNRLKGEVTQVEKANSELLCEYNEAKKLLDEVFRKHESGLLPDRFIYGKIKTFLYGE